VTRDEYLRNVIALYLDAPDTPDRARRADWAIASTFHQRGVSLDDLAHAIRLAILRRHRREARLEDLEPICSLAYFRPLLEHLRHQPHDPGYVEYVRSSYRNDLEAMQKSAAHRQNAAVSRRR
jgi:hypothetical protein